MLGHTARQRSSARVWVCGTACNRVGQLAVPVLAGYRSADAVCCMQSGEQPMRLGEWLVQLPRLRRLQVQRRHEDTGPRALCPRERKRAVLLSCAPVCPLAVRPSELQLNLLPANECWALLHEELELHLCCG